LTIAVLGGGFAGLQAAIALRERGIPVVLLERRGILGGRASSYRDAQSGDEIDNGVHVLFGAHTATLDLIRRAGAESLLRWDPRSGPTWSDGPRTWTLRTAALPAPWHLVPGLLALRLPGRELRAAWRLLRRLGAGHPSQQATLSDELERGRVGDAARSRLFEPLSRLLCLADPERVAAALFGAAVRSSLLGSRRGARALTFRCGLAELHERLARHLEARGGRILRGARAEALELRDDRVDALLYRQRPREREAIQRGESGSVERLAVTAVVSAVPWHRVASLVSDSVRTEPPFAGLASLGGAPAISMAWWLEGRVLTEPWLGVAAPELCRVGTRAPGDAPDGPHQLLQALLLPPAADIRRRNSEIGASAARDLSRVLPRVAASIRRSLIVRDPLAVFAQTPDAATARPGPVTPVKGLFLAGDWTGTGLPASIEGAVRSGRDAARAAADVWTGA